LFTGFSKAFSAMRYRRFGASDLRVSVIFPVRRADGVAALAERGV
jgi:hypothetical protein